MEFDDIIREFRDSTVTRKDFYRIVDGKAFDVIAYKVNRIIRIDVKEHKE